MSTFGQWIHQHDLLLLCVAIVGASGMVLVFRWRSLHLWLIWLGLAGISLAGLLALRTPAATLSEHREASDATSGLGANDSLQATESSEPVLGSVEAIEKLIAGGGKPTLVEVYADFGVY